MKVNVQNNNFPKERNLGIVSVIKKKNLEIVSIIEKLLY